MKKKDETFGFGMKRPDQAERQKEYGEKIFSPVDDANKYKPEVQWVRSKDKRTDAANRDFALARREKMDTLNTQNAIEQQRADIQGQDVAAKPLLQQMENTGRLEATRTAGEYGLAGDRLRSDTTLSATKMGVAGDIERQGLANRGELDVQGARNTGLLEAQKAEADAVLALVDRRGQLDSVKDARTMAADAYKSGADPSEVSRIFNANPGFPIDLSGLQRVEQEKKSDWQKIKSWDGTQERELLYDTVSGQTVDPTGSFGMVKGQQGAAPPLEQQGQPDPLKAVAERHAANYDNDVAEKMKDFDPQNPSTAQRDFLYKLAKENPGEYARIKQAYIGQQPAPQTVRPKGPGASPLGFKINPAEVVGNMADAVTNAGVSAAPLVYDIAKTSPKDVVNTVGGLYRKGWEKVKPTDEDRERASRYRIN